MPNPLDDDSEFVPLTRIQILTAMGFTAIVLLLISKLWIQFGAATLLPVHWSGVSLLLGLGMGVGITIASSIVYALWAAYRESADHYLELVLKPLVLPDLIWLGVLPGLSEELLFRGVMLPAFGSDFTAIVFSSICFGVLHLSSLRQWPYVIWATVVGAALGVSAVTTNNLVVPMTAHIATNFISSCLWKWEERKKHQSGQ